MRSAAFFGSFFVVVACSSADQPCALTAIGAACANDTDCCTGWCELEGDGAYCQTKPKDPTQACVNAGSFCTQDRNCCSGLCDNGACFASGGGASCLSPGSTCLQPDSCCSDLCMSDGVGHTWCATPPQPDGGSCGLPGDACSQPGPDPDECCFGICGPDGTCASGGGGGGGGGNCGQSGASCRYGSDCCSGECEQLSSTSSCH